ncbi:NAD(P)-binding protein [Coprinopsis marcescibilis]|uniref:NAD(P)-binding protein n=1 Tax=Coprinopsis marcescibilis TaxID=230819 RepID=A0A5C3KU12_COPMA|nr:NAD(P)-binding protein [Coprinopsis marcescibilis]
MPSQAIAVAANATYYPGYVPTMVVVGGTSGVGEAIARSFATHTKGRATIVLVGRNKAAADKILASLYKPAPEIAKDSTYEFISCDILSMKNIHLFNEDLKKKLNKVNYLVLSAGGPVSFKNSRNDTEDGLDAMMAMMFYARFAVLHGLLPLLEKAKDLGEDAGVMSVLRPWYPASWVDMDDLGLKKNFTFLKAIVATCAYNDLMLQGFSEREPDIGFTHIHPGSVDTMMFQSQNWILHILLRLFAWIWTITPEKCGEWMLYALLQTKRGLTLRNGYGDEEAAGTTEHATEQQKRAFWEHCVSSVTVSEE